MKIKNSLIFHKSESLKILLIELITNKKTMNTIKQLPEQFSGTGEVRGYDFGLICKTNQGFLYEVRLSGIITHYEVFHRKTNNRWACISYPTSKAFGIWAWSYSCLEKAQQKLNSL